MLPRLFTIIRYYLFWIAFFVAVRVFFELYNISLTAGLSFGTVLGTFVHGLKLDLSMGGYLTAFVALTLAATIRCKGCLIAKIVGVTTIVFIIIFSMIGICDCELYRNWGFRMDSTVLMYLKTPKEAAASTSVWLTVIFLVWIAVFCWFCIKAYRKFVGERLQQLEPESWKVLPAMLLVCAFLVIPIRGGFGMPIRSGSVYFSDQQFANHAAINVQWNFCNSLRYTNVQQTDNFMPQAQADSIVAEMLHSDSLQCHLLKTSRPNILIMIMESFTAKVVGCVGGIEGVTPNLDSLARTGVLFSNCYSNADRSDKGIVSILSGYPAQPTTSIMKFTDKAAKLPHLSHKLNAEGYTSSFYYGGDIGFANMNSYFIAGQYNPIVSKDEFQHSDMNSKWGAHDHIVLDRWLNDIGNSQAPFFSALFTLSSHEPFEVPHTSRFLKNSFLGKAEPGKFMNTVHYTDSCIGDFVRRAAAEPWWDNTLLVLVADHGNRLPDYSTLFAPERFHIPMIWLGGALAKTDTVIGNYLSQNDIPLLLCNQLEVDGSDFYFSKDVLSGGRSWGFYAYNNGIGFVTENEKFIYDRTAKKLIKTDVNNTSNFHIPMTWIDAVRAKTDTVKYENISKLPQILSQQFGTDNSFAFSADTTSGNLLFEIYLYRKGIGFIAENEDFTYVKIAPKQSKKDISDDAIMQSQAFLQTLLHDFNQK